MVPWTLMALIVCVELFHSVDRGVWVACMFVCLWVSPHRSSADKMPLAVDIWINASHSSSTPLRLHSLCSSQPTHRLLKSIKMSHIQIHTLIYGLNNCSWLEAVKPNEHVQPVRVSWIYRHTSNSVMLSFGLNGHIRTQTCSQWQY